MPTEAWYQLPALAACLVGSAFFSGSETALFSLREDELEEMRRTGSAGALRAVNLVEQPNRTLVTLLLANMLLNVLISVLITSLSLAALGERGLAVAIPVATVVLVLFGEILPKTIGLRQGRVWAERCARPVGALAWTLGPVRRGLERLASWIAGPARAQSLPREELGTLLDVARDEGTLTPFERRVLFGILELASENARRLMTPRVDVVAIEASSSPEDAAALFENSGRNRVVVYEENLDRVVGVLLLKDFLTQPEAASIRDRMRPAQFVPETQDALALFRMFQSTRQHLAVVVGEHGGVDGIVTLEDILEEIVGDIRDEGDATAAKLAAMMDGSWRTDARIELDELRDTVGIDLTATTESVTLSGLLEEELGRVPRAGDRWQHEEIEFRVLTASATRPLQVLIRREAT